VVLTIEDDYITRHRGRRRWTPHLMRSHIAAWASRPGDREAYAVSHVGYGLNHAARWDSMALYDKRDFNGTELRAFAGNFLYSTGANEVARPPHAAATSTCRCAAAPCGWTAPRWWTHGRSWSNDRARTQASR
jgi:hypothetical protein